MLAILWVLATLLRTDAKLVEGELKTNEDWAFIGRFCFLSEEGEFEYMIQFNEADGNPNLLLYYDDKTQWPAVYKSNKTCHGKESVLNVKLHQIINLTVDYDEYVEYSGCEAVAVVTTTTTSTASTLTVNVPTRKVRPRNDTAEELEEMSPNSNETLPTKAPVTKRHVYKGGSKPKNRVILCQHARRFRSSRERWWFIAVSNCNRGINIKYRLLMTNGPPGDYFHEHFSADQFYILPVLIAYSVVYSFLMLATFVCSVELKSRQLLHSTYKLFVVSVVIEFFGIILELAAYLKFAVNGIGLQAAKTFGSMLMGCSETCFLLMLLLLAKGYTVTRGRLRLGSSVKLTVFMCLYSVTYISIFIYEAKVFDPGEVLYLYESPAGYGLIVLRIIAWLMFVYSTVFTLKHYPEKSVFYYPFNICGTLWFVAGPAFILSANTYIDKWVRESVVCAVLLFITFAGHIMFLILTLPAIANKNFPYHVRTSQIGIMEITGASGVSTIENFGHHVYEPSRDKDEERVIIPLTRRTEEELGSNPPKQSELAEEMIADDTVTMQNVLSWSIAKNHTAFDVSRNKKPEPAEEPETPQYVASPSSSCSWRTKAADEADNGDVLHDSYEYVKDVPVELFTVSRLMGKMPTERQ